MEIEPMMAQRIAEAVAAFTKQRTGHVMRDVTVALSGDTLVVTLHESLTKREKLLARTPAIAALVREYHHRLFAHISGELRGEIARIIGALAGEQAAEGKPGTGVMVHALTPGMRVQVFLMTEPLVERVWEGTHNEMEMNRRERGRAGRASETPGRRGWL